LNKRIEHVENNILKINQDHNKQTNGPLQHDQISNKVKEAKYAVRGELAIRAEQLKHVSL
jgi:hypothetical protein